MINTLIQEIMRNLPTGTTSRSNSNITYDINGLFKTLLNYEDAEQVNSEKAEKERYEIAKMINELINEEQKHTGNVADALSNIIDYINIMYPVKSRELWLLINFLYTLTDPITDVSTIPVGIPFAIVEQVYKDKISERTLVGDITTVNGLLKSLHVTTPTITGKTDKEKFDMLCNYYNSIVPEWLRILPNKPVNDPKATISDNIGAVNTQLCRMLKCRLYFVLLPYGKKDFRNKDQMLKHLKAKFLPNGTVDVKNNNVLILYKLMKQAYAKGTNTANDIYLYIKDAAGLCDKSDIEAIIYTINNHIDVLGTIGNKVVEGARSLWDNKHSIIDTAKQFDAFTSGGELGAGHAWHTSGRYNAITNSKQKQLSLLYNVASDEKRRYVEDMDNRIRGTTDPKEKTRLEEAKHSALNSMDHNVRAIANRMEMSGGASFSEEDIRKALRYFGGA